MDWCTNARAKYLPIELDQKIRKEEKEIQMIEWSQISQNLIKKLGPTKDLIKVYIIRIVESSIRIKTVLKEWML